MSPRSPMSPWPTWWSSLSAQVGSERPSEGERPGHPTWWSSLSAQVGSERPSEGEGQGTADLVELTLGTGGF